MKNECRGQTVARMAERRGASLILPPSRKQPARDCSRAGFSMIIVLAGGVGFRPTRRCWWSSAWEPRARPSGQPAGPQREQPPGPQRGQRHRNRNRSLSTATGRASTRAAASPALHGEDGVDQVGQRMTAAALLLAAAASLATASLLAASGFAHSRQASRSNRKPFHSKPVRSNRKPSRSKRACATASLLAAGRRQHA